MLRVVVLRVLFFVDMRLPCIHGCYDRDELRLFLLLMQIN